SMSWEGLNMKKVLEVNNLSVSFRTYGGEVQAVRDVNFELHEGETLAIVGESGSGKSVTVQSIMRLLSMPPAEFKGGSILMNGEDIVAKSEDEMEKIRGQEMGMIFQDPMTSLNPTMKIGRQITEGLIKHQGMSKADAHARGVELLKLVGIPKILIADEPTTALDVTIQAQILELLRDIQEETKTAIILITHDLGVVANAADRVAVMYGGKIVETGTVDEIFYQPKHPYTWG